METSLYSTGNLGWGAWHGARTLHSSGGELCSQVNFSILYCHMQVWDQPVPCLCPSHKSRGGLLWTSPAVGLLFSYISGDFKWWLFCSLAVIFIYVVVRWGKHDIYLLCHHDSQTEFLDFEYIATIRKTSINKLNSRLETTEENRMECSTIQTSGNTQKWIIELKRKI